MNRSVYSMMMEPAELLNAEQNAQVVVNGEAYFRGLWESGAVETWNLRDQHFVQTCLRLIEFHRPLGSVEDVPQDVKVVLWAHNSHVGDARATELGSREEWNLGQMMRTTFGDDKVFLCGFGTHSGQVTAATEWGGEPQSFELNEPEEGSIDDVMHRALLQMRQKRDTPHSEAGGQRQEGSRGVEPAELNTMLLLLKDPCEASTPQGEAEGELSPLAEERLAATREAFNQPRRQRAIGVQYKKETEATSHYVQAAVAKQFDAWIHVDRTTALEPLS
mmetsp:Transcript_19697/g.40152  ORF Transcript_19697/g.40152 Transcript_19697/m.40152 type:complete len:276 (-) Transcript_19697:230-1057(-)